MKRSKTVYADKEISVPFLLEEAFFNGAVNVEHHGHLVQGGDYALVSYRPAKGRRKLKITVTVEEVK